MVRAEFNAHIGARVLMTLNHLNKPVPFGSTVTVNDSQQSSLVGDDGQVYLSGLPPSGTLVVQWGEGDDKRCSVAYQLSADQMTTFNRVAEICH